MESGSVYEQVDDQRNVMSRTTYGENRKPGTRDDLTGRPHFDKNSAVFRTA